MSKPYSRQRRPISGRRAGSLQRFWSHQSTGCDVCGAGACAVGLNPTYTVKAPITVRLNRSAVQEVVLQKKIGKAWKSVTVKLTGANGVVSFKVKRGASYRYLIPTTTATLMAKGKLIPRPLADADNIEPVTLSETRALAFVVPERPEDSQIAEGEVDHQQYAPQSGSPRRQVVCQWLVKVL